MVKQSKRPGLIKNPLRHIFAPLTWFHSGVRGKTSWEWLELLIVPLFLAAGAFYLVVVYTLRDSEIRLISARKATRTERKQYTES